MKPLIKTFLILIILIAFIPLLGKAEEDEAIGTITFIQGACQIKSEDGDYEDAVLDQTVYAKQAIKTLESSEAEIALFDGNVVRVTEDSETVVDSLQIRENRYTNIGLIFGSIKLFVKRFSKDSEEFSVNTATVTAGVRGTEFDVSIREDGEVLINVLEGEIETEYDGEKHTITRGNASTFDLIEARRDFKELVDQATWRKQALDRLRENPALFIRKMLERERVIIARLKQNQARMEQYRKDFVIFLKKAKYLEQNKMYRQERALILQQIEKTRKAIGFFIIARRQLVGIRSLIVLAARIEQRLDPETVKQLPSLLELKREYQKINYVIIKINQADRKLRGVLFLLNRRLDELNRKIESEG
jgi:hypothetical protein